MKKVLSYWFPVIIFMGIIFISSSMTYHQQDIRSSVLSLLPLHWLEPLVAWISFTYGGSEVSVAALGMEGFVEFFIRKGAHLTVFGLLGFFTYRLLYQQFRFSIRACLYVTVIMIIAYASLDEIHQYFTGDRTPLVQDVMIDSIGGGIGIYLYIRYIRDKYIKN